MKRCSAVLLALASSLLCGCHSLWDAQLQSSQTELADVGGDLTERSRQLTAAVLDISGAARQTRPSPEWALIHRLAAEDQRLEGLPIQRLDTTHLLRLREKALNRALNRYEDQNTTLLLQQRQLHTRIDTLEQKLRQGGWWGWLIGCLGVTGVIILAIILFPSVVLPLLTMFIGWITRVIPGLVGFLGIVSKCAFDSVVLGLQKAREQLKKEPDRTFTGKEVLDMLDKNLAAKQDVQTENTVTVRKARLLGKER